MTFINIKEQLLDLLIHQLDAMAFADDYSVRRTHFDKAFGAVEFVCYNLATNSKEMREVQEIWEYEYRETFEKVLENPLTFRPECDTM
jgi:hypothetical protein